MSVRIRSCAFVDDVSRPIKFRWRCTAPKHEANDVHFADSNGGGPAICFTPRQLEDSAGPEPRGDPKNSRAVSAK